LIVQQLTQVIQDSLFLDYAITADIIFDFELGARMFKIYWEPVLGEIKEPMKDSIKAEE